MKRIGMLFGVLGVLVALGALGWWWATDRWNDRVDAPRTLSELLSIRQDHLHRVDIALMNLLCATGLPGAEDLDAAVSLAALDQMAVRVKGETDRHLYRFSGNPAEFEYSEGFFRMLMLGVVLSEDFHVEYAPGKAGSIADSEVDDGFFADAHDVFLHGLTGSRRQGTCSSLPVLQVAVGRRLGYPLKLVTTKGHLFLRWEDARERFNIEAAGHGVSRFPNEYYLHWPVETSVEEVAAQGYLKSLTPAEELAAFMSIRGHCLRQAECYKEAAETFSAAARLAPRCSAYRTLAVQAQSELSGVGMASGM